MRFANYMRESRRSPIDLARQLQCSRTAVSKWVHGHRYPSFAMVSKIAAATGGMVTYVDWEEQRGEAAAKD